MRAIVLALYNSSLISPILSNMNLLRSYVNVSCEIHFEDKCHTKSCKQVALYKRHRKYALEAVTKNNSILVLEDDFVPLENLRIDLPNITYFVKHSPCEFDYINLGGVGSNFYKNSNVTLHKRWTWHSQAVIYSACNKLHTIFYPEYKGHFDWLLHYSKAFMTRPLIVQSNLHHKRLELGKKFSG